MESSYAEGDHVFCYEPMLGRVRALYEAKVISISKRRVRESTVKLKFFDWNKIYSDRNKKCLYEHDIPESFVCKPTQQANRLMHRLARAAKEFEGPENKRAKLISDLIVKAYDEKKIRRLPPGLVLNEEPSRGGVGGNPSHEGSRGQDNRPTEDYRVTIELGDDLKRILEQDYSRIKIEEQVAAHSGPTVLEIFEAFLRHHTHHLLFGRLKNIKDGYKHEKRIALTKEVLEGLRCLFDTLLPSNLLYNEELSAHTLLMSGKDIRKVQQDNSSPVSRRQTRSSVAESANPSGETTSHSNQRPVSDPLKVATAAQQLVHKLEQHKDSQRSAEPLAKKPRLAAHMLQSSTQNMASGRSTPTQNMQADLIMKEVNEWRLIPQDILDKQKASGVILPCTKYGAIHLLRLFVKLPDILTRMKIADECRSFLVGSCSALLSYMLEERCELFDDVTYIAAADSIS